MRFLLHFLRYRAPALALAIGALVAPAYAEDIDIYANPNAATDVPNVLFVLDNSANWSSDIPAAPEDCRSFPTGAWRSSASTATRPAVNCSKYRPGGLNSAKPPKSVRNARSRPKSEFAPGA